MYHTKLSKIGNSYGVILPKEVISHLNAKSGCELFIVETPNGIEITSYDQSFAEAVSIAEQIMDDNKNVLKKLAE